MKKKSSFEKKYPLLVPYIENEIIRENMCYNPGLEKKYNHTSSLLETFILSLNQNFLEEEVSELIQETFLKFTEEELISFIKAYLHSSFEVQKNKDSLLYFRKTLKLGGEAIAYIEEKGIILGRKYMEIPTLIANNEYIKYAIGDETYKEKELKTIFFTLPLEQKQFLLPFVKTHETDLLTLVFSTFEDPLTNLLEFLIKKNVTHYILNRKCFHALEEPLFMRFVFLLLKQETTELERMAYSFVEKERFSLISYLIQNGLFERVTEVYDEELDTLEDSKVIELLTKREKNLKKTEN